MQRIQRDKRHYYEMQIADFILNNAAQHGLNWGLYMDPKTGELEGLHPLIDYDNAFDSTKDIMSQTTEEDMTLLHAAKKALEYVSFDLEAVGRVDAKELLEKREWESVLDRIRILQEG